MDGLDLIVGAVVSAAVAGLGAVVVAYLGSMISRSPVLIAAIAWVTGAVFMSGSYTLISGVPDREELISLVPSVVRQAYVDKSIDGTVLRFHDAFGRSVTISPRKDYYSDLVAAIDAAQNYRVLYAREHTLFSNGETAYTVVYDVSVNGKTLESYEHRVNQLKLFCSGAFVFGLVMFVGGFLAPPLPNAVAGRRAARPEASV